jgi:chitin-binding protein
MLKTDRRVIAAAAAALLGGGSNTAAAHGSAEYPISRQYACYKNNNQPACQAAAQFSSQAVYDWNGVNQGNANGNHRAVIPDGKICAGGLPLFVGFDLPRNDWQTTNWAPGADGRYEYRYHATAPHAAKNFQFFMTRDGWNHGARALQWSDLDLVAEVQGNQIQRTPDQRFLMKVSLPRRTGKHIVFTAWQRSDSPEAFYACSDVNFGGDGGNPPPTGGFTQIGQITANSDLPAGARVRLRVFGNGGADLESHDVAITAANGRRAVWLAQLATITNNSSRNVRVGELRGADVVVPANATAMQVYAVPSSGVSSVVIDTQLPDPPAPPPPPPPAPPPPAPPAPPPPPPAPPPPPVGTRAWVEGGSYTAGQLVAHQGATYVCLQTHTAWQGTGWKPDVTPSLWSRR